MNREVTTKAFKQQLKIALQGPANHPFFQASKELLRMIISLEVHGISYEFIDPETQTEAMRIGRLIQDATTATTNPIKVIRNLLSNIILFIRKRFFYFKNFLNFLLHISYHLNNL